MKYLIIIPAYNEENFIGRIIESIIQQSLLPQTLLIVNDGSTDNTSKIVQDYAQKHPWIKLVNHQKKEGHAAGAKVVRAFYVGYNSLSEHDYDFLVKLDADLEISADYFEKIAQIFEENPKVGIAGGTILLEKNGQWVYENFSDRDHVKGAFKAYRKECFEAIGGLRFSIGWDTADELLSRYHGWEIKVDPSLEVKHYRELGTETGSIKIREKVGLGMYRLRYKFWITLISAIKGGYLNRPYGLTGLAILVGFFKGWIKKDQFMVTEEEGKFIREFRLNRMKKKLGFRK